MGDSTGDRRLAELCADLFLFLTTFRRTARQVETDPVWFRRRLIEIFDAQAAAASTNPDIHRRYEQARYPLAALTDEIALNTEWKGRAAWEEELLEQRFFGTSIAGEEFFVRAQQLPPDDDQLAEIYFLCLALGFRGRYRSRPEERRELEQALYARLPGRIVKKTEALCPSAYDSNVERDMTRLPALSAARVAVVLGGAILFAWFASDFVTKRIIGDLNTLATEITTTAEKGKG